MTIDFKKEVLEMLNSLINKEKNGYVWRELCTIEKIVREDLQNKN